MGSALIRAGSARRCARTTTKAAVAGPRRSSAKRTSPLCTAFAPLHAVSASYLSRPIRRSSKCTDAGGHAPHRLLSPALRFMLRLLYRPMSPVACVTAEARCATDIARCATPSPDVAVEAGDALHNTSSIIQAREQTLYLNFVRWVRLSPGASGKTTLGCARTGLKG